MTTTDIYSAVTIGTAGTDGANAVKTTLQTTTAAVQIHAAMTNGAKAQSRSSCAVLHYIVSPFDITTAQALTQLKYASKKIDLVPADLPGGIRISVTEVEPALGAYLFTWLEYPTMSPAQTLTAKLVEL